MSSFAAKPSAIAVARPMLVTLTGTGTSWTSGTTFSVADLSTLGATISNVTIVSATQATMTISGGKRGGTAKLSCSDGTNVTISVYTNAVLSGSNLVQDSGGSPACADATTDWIGHVLTVAGTAYWIHAVAPGTAATVNGVAGTYTRLTLFNAASGAAISGLPTNPAAGASWSITFYGGGSGSLANHVVGHNLIADYDTQQYWYDPDYPITQQANQNLIISGVGFNDSANASGFGSILPYNTTKQGSQNLLQMANNIASNPAYGGTWTLPGTTPKAPTVHPEYLGDINVLLIGDSNTYNLTQGANPNILHDALVTAFPNAHSWTVTNMGVSGISSAQLNDPNSNNLPAILTAIDTVQPTVIVGTIGTNDIRSDVNLTLSQSISNVTAMSTAVTAKSSVRKLVLVEQPYAVPGSGSGSQTWNAAGNVLLRQLFAGYSAIAIANSKVRQGISNEYTNHAFTLSNSGSTTYSADGIHFNDAGKPALVYTIVESIADSILSVVDTTPPAVPSGLTVKTGDGHLLIKWTNPSDSDFESVKVRRAGTVIYTGPGAAFLDDGLTNGVAISYTVSAVDWYGNESAQSAAVTGTPQDLTTTAQLLAAINAVPTATQNRQEMDANSTKLAAAATQTNLTSSTNAVIAAVAGVAGGATAQQVADALAGRVDVYVYCPITGSAMTLFAGDDYSGDQAITIVRQPSDSWWPATISDVTFGCKPSAELLELVPTAPSITGIIGSVSQPVGSNQAFTLALSSTLTATLTSDARRPLNGYTFIIRANVQSGSPKVLRSGTLTVLPPA